jgi:tRNA (guanine37-N1)-methyltransferase
MTTLRDSLRNKLSEKELFFLKTSYDIVGDIAILEIPDELKKKEKIIAEELLKLNKNTKVVCKKAGIHSGEFRVQKLKFLAGEKRKDTLYKENNVKIKLNPEKVYFSVRLSSERKRIYELINKETNRDSKKESILVMFSGSGVYPLVISKNTKAKEIYGIEINPFAHKMALENLELNKIKNVKLFKGDVKKVIPKLNKKFDRILMPLPKDAENFLETAFLAAKKGTIIHLYDFAQEKDFADRKKRVTELSKRLGKKIKILNLVKCGQYAPFTFRICIDFRVL